MINLKRLSYFLIVVMVLVATVGCKGKENPDSSDASKGSSQTDLSLNSSQSDLQKYPTEQELVYVRGLCVSELPSFYQLPVSEIQKRLADFAEIGIKSVRYDINWSDVEPNFGRTSTPKNKLDIAKLIGDSGLRIKLIAGTIMCPPQWFFNRTLNSRLIDEDGRASINTISYWLPDVTKYTEQACEKIMIALKESGLIDIVDTMVIDMGPAGEPIYPPTWTQVVNGLDVEAGAEKFWCYDVNAQADFTLKMQEKYKTIEKANDSWGKNYKSWDSLSVPKPGTAPGKMWEDVLNWYRDTKREFMEKQIQAFIRISEKYSGGRIRPILYIPGSELRDESWDEAVNTGQGDGSVRIMTDSRYIVQLAAKYNCLLQYTGFNNEPEVAYLRNYMDENGYGNIPMYGENAGSYECAKDPLGLAAIVKKYKLDGIDYTHTRFLFEADMKTQARLMVPFKRAISEIKIYLESRS